MADDPPLPPNNSKELMDMFDVNVAGTASVMKHMIPLVLDSNEKKVSPRTLNGWKLPSGYRTPSIELA